jgi:hypothetical protein
VDLPRPVVRDELGEDHVHGNVYEAVEAQMRLAA